MMRAHPGARLVQPGSATAMFGVDRHALGSQPTLLQEVDSLCFCLRSHSVQALEHAPLRLQRSADT